MLPAAQETLGEERMAQVGQDITWMGGGEYGLGGGEEREGKRRGKGGKKKERKNEWPRWVRTLPGGEEENMG
jgi:hypothetical protein